jgi:hypothetical protein
MLTAVDVPRRDANSAVITRWIRDWQPRVLAAATALAPVAASMPAATIDFASELKRALESQRELVVQAGFEDALCA